tara:strand:+ start:87 stop:1187 length:1101 start_codon:yes stop_codon:yes gene_type:complete
MKFNLNKIILITGGFDHIDAYKFLKKNNIDVIVFDDDPNCYLKKKFKNIKIKPIKNNIKLIKYLKIFCWSPCSDLGSSLADRINKKNSFPIRSINMNLKFDKLSQKKYLIKNKILTPKLAKFKKGKTIIKHIHGSGSKNIYLNFVDSKKYYCEELIEGIEISVDTITFDTNHQILMTSYRDLENYKSACSIIPVPFLMKNKNLNNAIISLLNSLNIIGGVCHLEFILKDNNFFLIDANIRCGGFGVTSHLLKKIKGQNLFKLDLLSLFSKKIKINHNSMNACLVYTRKNSVKIKNIKFKNSTNAKIINLDINQNPSSVEITDSTRKQIICIFSKSNRELLKEIKKYYFTDHYKNLIKNINYLSLVK